MHANTVCSAPPLSPPVWVLRLHARERACRGWGVPAQSIRASYSHVSGAEGQKGGVPFHAPCANGAGVVHICLHVLFSVRVEAGAKEGQRG